MLRVTAAMAAVPLAALMLLVGVGAAAPLPVLAAAAAVVVSAFGLAALWTHDMQVLGRLLHQAGAGGVAGGATIGAFEGAAAPTLMLSPQLLGEVAFVAQSLGERENELDRLRRAEESILERLPDPLIVLGPDRAVRRTNAAARQAFGGEMAAVLRHPDLRAAIDRVLAAGGDRPPQTVELSIPVPVPREVHATVAALMSPLAGGAGALVVLSDRAGAVFGNHGRAGRADEPADR